MYPFSRHVSPHLYLTMRLRSASSVWCYGPEFTSRRMLGRAEERKIKLIYIQPGRPIQRGHVESFHGRLRDECLNANWFRTLNDVRRTLDNWLQQYNCERPQSALAYRTPSEFRRALGCGDGVRTAVPTGKVKEEAAMLKAIHARGRCQGS